MILALLIGVWAACAALAPNVWISAALVAPVVVLGVLWWMLERANRWVTGFLWAALLLPPLPIAIGNSGPHPALLVAAVGAWAGVLRIREWNVHLDAAGRAMLLFLAILVCSAGPAAFYWGPEIAAGSLARTMLFAISVYVYLYTANGPGGAVSVRGLLFVALAAASFACLDFYFQFPAPAGYGAQFVWLDAGVLRRAQGFFYEASTLGNFCAFILVLVAVLWITGANISKWFLAITAAVVSAALVFSYSRASMVAVACALLVLLYMRKGRAKPAKWVLLLPFAIAAGGFGVYLVFPEFAQSYLLRASASFEFLFDEPNRILSGRLATWRAVLDLIGEHPEYLLWGAGYKTLPYSDLAVIADNMYLSLLIETGVPGLLAFLWLNLKIFEKAFHARDSVLGLTMFCFWTGEMVQMLSGDLFTYWRVLPLYFWALSRCR